ncbi:hypothetical protein F6V30_08235 [Oryzomonas sagensis]|uniref:Uncharacterized protein n=1 Tax=Oryzomonas sagensis TaxID=2603857 RepID=A0ABQ6TNM1_9BACT|nr:hypothetical protein [Oryzomonas sagensis]KAB0670140.1 hypothetical protein F6V30_08235 [Oryzomonas sagensis]
MNKNPFQAYVDEIERLKNDLFEARYTILNLMPEKFERLLKGYYQVKSRQEGYAWEHDVAEQIIAEANILSKEEGSFLEDRAYCPLCGRGSNSPYDRGFAIPEGLRRHLTGWGNNSRCDVMEAAFRLARDHWHRSFHEKEEQEKKEKEQILFERRRKETLFFVDLYSQPCLLEEGVYTYDGRVRNEEELLWAEQRLHGLGVNSLIEGNVKKYIDEYEEYLVLADPRVNGKISFKVYRKPLIKKGKIGVKRPLYQSFYMQDAWKNDLPAKYTSRVRECINSLKR